MEVIAGYSYSGPAADGIEIIELPAEEDAVCGVHLGSMERIAESWHAIHTEVVARGLVHAGPCRELYVRAVGDDQSDWVTELQQPVARR
jgi:effector-binding domain-containing protein